jgi:glycogen synthase
MKIGVVVPRLDGGGTAQCVVDLTNGLADAGLRPIVVCLERMGYLAEKIFSRVKVIGPLKRTGNDPTAPFRLAAILREHHCDVVHCHNWGGLVDAVLAAKLARVGGVLHTQHGLDYRFNYSPDHLRSRLRVPAPDHGHEVRARWRRELGIDESDVLIGTVATFRPVKDLHTMLEAMSLVARARPRAKLVLLGDGPLKHDLTATVERLGLGSVVRFPGWRNDATQLLPAMDLFVLSSLSEGISLALLEAMAAGVPVVATKVGGNLEVLREPSSGLLVPPRSPHDLAHAILSLIDDAARRSELSAGGRGRVAEAFSLKRMVKDYEGLYTSLMSTRSERGTC